MCDSDKPKVEWELSGPGFPSTPRGGVHFDLSRTSNRVIRTDMTPTKWDYRFAKLAQHIAEWSHDPSTKVGSVIVRLDKTIAGVGYNGYARGVRDENLEDREYKYPRVIHAELNAILNSSRDLQGTTLYATLAPCSACAGAIIQSGIKRVIHIQENYEERPKWHESHKVSIDMFQQAGVQCYGIYLSKEGITGHDKFKINH